jgi:hypothetical protein
LQVAAELAIVGPLDKLVITGPVRLANTKLTGFDLGSKLGALSAFAGKAASNPDTSIQNASLNARVAPEGTKADNINLTVSAIGIITGAGTVTSAGVLNYKMLADLKGGVVGGLTQVAALGSGKGGIPFVIEGTTSNPHFIRDMKVSSVRSEAPEYLPRELRDPHPPALNQFYRGQRRGIHQPRHELRVGPRKRPRPGSQLDHRCWTRSHPARAARAGT